MAATTVRLDVSPRSSNSIVREREALEELVKTEGWSIFLQHCTTEFKGGGYFARMGAAINTNDPLAPKVLHRAALEIERLANWPMQRLLELQGVVDD